MIVSEYLKLIVERGEKSNILFYMDRLVDLRSEHEHLSFLKSLTFEATAFFVLFEM